MSVSTHRSGAVTTITLDRRAVRNAIDVYTAEALSEAFLAFDADPEAAVAVLWGAGGHFCAGADLHAISQGNLNRLESSGAGPLGPTRHQLSKPVIAAISGYAVAGGLELALWCDLRIVEADATLGVFCRRLGVPLIDGGTVRLPRLIGMGRALDLILTGRPVGAEEALGMGLVTRVVPRGCALEEAQALAATLSQLPQACLRSDRASVYAQAGKTQAEALDIEFRLGIQSLEQEGFAGAGRFARGAGRNGSVVAVEEQTQHPVEDADSDGTDDRRTEAIDTKCIDQIRSDAQHRAVDDKRKQAKGQEGEGQ